MMIFCMGLAPIGTLTTDLVISAAPPERAGAASGISETSFEFGGALGIAVLGSIVAAVYRTQMTALTTIASLDAETLEAARSTLGGALAAAHGLPAEDASHLTDAAREAFTHAFTVTSAIAAICALLAAILAAVFLRHARAGN